MRTLLHTGIPHSKQDKSTPKKTMAGSLAAELLGSLQVHEYRKCIPYISPGSGISRAEFATREEHARWQIDTSLNIQG